MDETIIEFLIVLNVKLYFASFINNKNDKKGVTYNITCYEALKSRSDYEEQLSITYK